MADIIVRKQQFVQVLKERFFLRFHMSLILIGTAMVGLLVSKLLLMADMTNMVIRYPLAIVFAYLAFFGFIKLWLSYLSASRDGSLSEVVDSVVDGVTGIPDLSGVSGPSLSSGGAFGGGGGGSFGGGGATGSFDSAVAPMLDSGKDGITSAAGDAAGEAASGILEDNGWVLVVLGILLAIVFGAGIFLLYQAPFILTEAAFDFALSASLVKSARKIDATDWTHMGGSDQDNYLKHMVNGK